MMIGSGVRRSALPSPDFVAKQLGATPLDG
jgi:hypothetical protein